MTTSPSAPIVSLRDLTKVYVVHEREAGTMAAIKSLVRRRFIDVLAVDHVSFDIQPGEIVGFLGPNGAGKTTTIKLMSGLLYPTSGHVSVLGHTPSKRKKAFLQQITLVMGRRGQLIWDVPAIESFDYFKAIYDVPEAQFRETRDELIALMDLEPILYKPVRNLSLGERMKCEMAASLLHRPQVLLLDEPTIGLDLIAQTRFREYIAKYNKRFGSTVLLTSHYVGDVEALCQRLIFIDKARIIYDGDAARLVDRFLPYKNVEVTVDDPACDLRMYGAVVSRDNGRIMLHVPRESLMQTTRALLANLRIKDLSISDPPMTDVIKHVYGGGLTDTETVGAGREWRRA
jgi:ABC-2 type transport system ATP-binding protein